jgi:hypothetical protein
VNARLTLLVLASVFAPTALAQPAPDGTVDFRAKDYRSDLETKTTIGEGDVRVAFDSQVVEADRVEIDGRAGRVRARGNVRYTKGPLEIRGRVADVDVKTGFGTFDDATLRVGTSVFVEGKILEHYAKDRYRARQGKISICQDCPQSWSVTGSLIDVENEGFATVDHALVQLRDNPVLYLPVFAFPVKTRRQSGFLFPTYVYQVDMGSQLRQPYFWAINPASDATLRYDYLSKGGQRAWTEYRYAYSDRSWARLRGSVIRSPREVRYVRDLESARWGYSIDQRWQLSPQWTQRFQGELASDRYYTQHFPEDFSGRGLPTLRHSTSIAWQDGKLFGYGTLRMLQDNFPRDPDGAAAAAGAADPRIYTGYGMIHNLPDAGLSLPATRLWGPILGSGDFRYLSFRRSGPSIDPDTGWIRTGDRGTLRLRANAPQNVFSLMKWEPSIETQMDAYAFQSPVPSRAAFRGRVIFDQRLSGDVFRVYKTDIGELKAIRHSVTPVVRWSYSPRDARTRHPFFDSVVQSDAPQFDLFDPQFSTAVTEFSTFNEEQRLGHHHLMTFGLESRVVGRYGETNRRIEEFLSAGVNRDFNLLTNRWGNIRINAVGAYSGFRLSTELTLNTRELDGRGILTANLRNDFSYENSNVRTVLLQIISPGVETYGVGGELRFLRPWTVAGLASYSAVTKRPVDQNYVLGFDGGASKCFYLQVTFANDRGDPDTTKVRFTNVAFGLRIADDLKASSPF